MTKVDTSSIHRVKNFLDQSLYEYFELFFSNTDVFSDKNIQQPCMYNYHEYNVDFDDNSLFKKNLFIYQEKIYSTLKKFYGTDVVRFSGTSFRKWYPGEYQPPHSDCEAEIDVVDDEVIVNEYNNFSSLFIEYAALVYLNDSYDGGEIYFPDHDLTIKPEANEMICFPGTKYFRHGVNTVNSGSRLVMQDFVTTPKLRYIWESFVAKDGPIIFSDQSQEYFSENKTVFSRSNVPRNFIYNRKN